MANHMLLGAVNAIKHNLRPGHNITEPDYLTAIVTKFPLLMNSTWGNVQYGGCFIHKSPIVTFQKGGRCEVGDLLVLCRKKVDNDIRYNAALFQLKKVQIEDRGKIKPDNAIQYDLYTKWPKFSFGRSFISGASYDITPKTVTPGAQYMLINDPDVFVHYYWNDVRLYFHPCVFTDSIPLPKMISRADLSFGHFLWDFIHWQNGRPITKEEESTTDEWSRFVWSLIAKTNKAIRNINVNLGKNSKVSKHQGDFFHFLTTTDCLSYLPKSYMDSVEQNGNETNEKDIKDSVSEEIEGGISILFIDINNERKEL